MHYNLFMPSFTHEIKRFIVHHKELFFIGVISMGLLLRFSVFLNRNTVKMLFSDQWELYEQFIQSPNLIHLFMFQYGPHRMGVGYWITFAVATLSHWDTTTETLINILFQVLTLLTLLFLKYRLFRRWHYSDIVIPIIVFSYKYYESFIIVPNISLAVLPIFLTCVLALIWTFHTPYKYILLCCIGSLTMFSGFGMLIAPSLLLLPLSGLKNVTISKQHKAIIYLVLLTFMMISYIFLARYSWDPSVNCAVNPRIDWINYPPFIGTMVLNYFYTLHSMYPFIIRFLGFGAYLALLVIGLNLGLRVLGRNIHAIHQVNLLFIQLTVIFIYMSTIGRSCLGIDAALAPRYLLYFLPAVIAMYFTILNISNIRLKSTLVVVFISIIILSEISSSPMIIKSARDYVDAKLMWINCYKNTKSVSYCENVSTIPTMPKHLYDRADNIMKYIQTNHLNIYNK